MAGDNLLDSALERLRVLIQNNPIKQLQGANEAKTRLLIIDEVLALDECKLPIEPLDEQTLIDARTTNGIK